MPARRHQGLLDGGFVDPAARFVCHVFEAVAALVVPEVIGGAAGLGAEALGAGAGALGGFSSLAGPEIAGLTAGEIGAGAGVGGAEAAGLTLGGGLADALSGGELLNSVGALDLGAGGGGADALTGALTPGSALTTGAVPGAQTALPAVSAGTSVGGPAAAAPSLPASVAQAAPTVTGDLTGAGVGGGTGGVGGTGLTEADYAAINNAPGMGGGGDAAAKTVAATGSKGGFLDRTLSSITGGSVGGGDLRDLGTVLSGGMMLKNVLGGDKTMPGEAGINRGAAGLEATARGQAALGTQLEGYLQSGKLPPGVEAGLRSATQAAHATIKSQHAARGTSGSSAEASEIQAANDRALAAGQQVAMQLLQQGSSMIGQGVNTEGLASQLYQSILANSLEKDRELGQSIGAFSSALARSGDSSSGNSITLKAA